MFTMGVNYIMSFSFSQKEIGKRIRDQRLKNKLTIEKLCELLDVSPSFIGLVERGTSGISIEKLYRLSEIFHVSTDYLIKGSQDINTSPQKQNNSALDALNAYLYNSTEDEILFILSLIKFIKPRVEIKQTDKN
ncbi:helix-turn-helix transcriptional regulator [Clostridium sp. ASF356]|nr:helix-turn-helix transcriptional regulator [Clostridium sp. MD294]